MAETYDTIFVYYDDGAPGSTIGFIKEVVGLNHFAVGMEVREQGIPDVS